MTATPFSHLITDRKLNKIINIGHAFLFRFVEHFRVLFIQHWNVLLGMWTCQILLQTTTDNQNLSGWQMATEVWMPFVIYCGKQ